MKSIPVARFIATANHYFFPNDYTWKEAVHFTWADPYRAARITELLGSGRLFSVAEIARVQNDDSVAAGARARAIAARCVPAQRTSRPGTRRCSSTWDYVLDKDSVPAGIYAMWQRRLHRQYPRPRRAGRAPQFRPATSSRPSG